MRKLIILAVLLILVLMLAPAAFSQEKPAAPEKAVAVAPAAAAPAVKPAETKPVVPFKAGATVFIEPSDAGFDAALKEAIVSKKVPIKLVDKKEDADFVLRSASESVKASTAKKAIMWNWHSNEQASISVVSVASGEVVFGYNVNKPSSAHGKRSTAEACAKHIKEKVEEAK